MLQNKRTPSENAKNVVCLSVRLTEVTANQRWVMWGRGIFWSTDWLLDLFHLSGICQAKLNISLHSFAQKKSNKTAKKNIMSQNISKKKSTHPSKRRRISLHEVRDLCFDSESEMDSSLWCVPIHSQKEFFTGFPLFQLWFHVYQKIKSLFLECY